MNLATISLLVAAAGRGVRAKAEGNKVLQPLAGRPMLWWTLRALTAPGSLPEGVAVEELIVAASPDDRADVLQAVAGSWPIPLKLVDGAASRQGSVARAAAAASGQYLLIHDAARPLVRPSEIAAVVAAAVDTGAAILAAPVSDTVKLSDTVGLDGAQHAPIAATVPRDSLWLAQTPQVFRAAILHEALRQALDDGFEGTDCASLVERMLDSQGRRLHQISLVAGGRHNLKVTFPEDWWWAEQCLSPTSDASLPAGP